MVGKKGLTVAECEHPGWRGSHRFSVPNFSDELMFEKGQEYFWCQNTGVKTGGSLFFILKNGKTSFFLHSWPGRAPSMKISRTNI